MGISGSLFRLIATIMACSFGALAVEAVEIKADPFHKSAVAVLEGKIEPGDFDKVRRFFLEGDGALEIYLASPGGDLVEAMKIGRFVRTLKLETIAPDKLNSEMYAKAHRLGDSKANYMCASACFFVFVSGIKCGNELTTTERSIMELLQKKNME